MKKLVVLVAFALSPMFFGACSLSGGSAPQAMAMDRSRSYDGLYNAYIKAEKKYLNLLFNIERMPDEDELWEMKREQMLELMQLKEMMLNARSELDNAIQEWEKYLADEKAQVKHDKIKEENPNFKGVDAQRTSPGQLLPGEFRPSKR